MPRRLIFDVGMHKGEDTEFYLSRGHEVVGVEANRGITSMRVSDSAKRTVDP